MNAFLLSSVATFAVTLLFYYAGILRGRRQVRAQYLEHLAFCRERFEGAHKQQLARLKKSNEWLKSCLLSGNDGGLDRAVFWESVFAASEREESDDLETCEQARQDLASAVRVLRRLSKIGHGALAYSSTWPTSRSPRGQA